MHTWPGADLVSARSIERTLQRQRAAPAASAACVYQRDRRRRSLAGALRRLGQHSDPRAIIRVERLFSVPPPVPMGEEQRAERGRRLRGIARLVGPGR